MAEGLGGVELRGAAVWHGRVCLVCKWEHKHNMLFWVSHCTASCGKWDTNPTPVPLAQTQP